ncbi:VWA domain-containing protein [Calidifontibacter sp. DB0510]|uniref:VWA domain-containing protein n=1 Tax=Metallococcus carri TaxID=1656884 RepID=A0A967B484_9MICO|nr:VWA domain-containing protein [Metallococcus carri]NHN57065.1 VWA domain-containing protein [Metallococcus carri]NOP39066.1 VWA domain-containing protein [Calidifontibacter sp. DB2511S]
MSPRSTYGRYAGGPDPLAPPVDLADALDAIGEEVMAGYSPEQAMREYLQRGSDKQRGLDDLMRQVQEKRAEMLAKHNLNGTLEQIKQLLDEAVLDERKQLARDLDDDARFAEMRMENLPSSPAAAVSELSDYQWRSSDAREKFEQIKDLLGRELLDQRFAGMKQALENATDADRERVGEMLRDLNELLEKRSLGEDTDADFAEFMDKHGEFFPENPSNLDELLDAMAQRAAAAQRMLNSMTPEQREELMQLSQQAFGSPELMDQLSQLDANLQMLRPGEDWGGSEQFEGEQGLGLGDGTGALQDIADLDRLSEQLDQQRSGARLDDIDVDAINRMLGEEAAVDARTLQELERALRESGYLKRGSDGSLRLSPKAMRQLGKALLRDVAKQMSSRTGQRDLRRAGAAGERTGASREWQFGDTEPWDVTRTITNAVQRTVADGGDPRWLRLDIRDVEVTETEARTQAAVALLVDTSYSMIRADRWVPMKRTALALHQLISTRFRGDHLQLIGFGRHAEVMDIEELTALEGMHFKGTNLHHGLLLANRHFRKHPSAQPVLLIVTDGEPTAHLERDGNSFFDYPPHPMTIALTVRELEAAGRLGAQTTFFQLGDDPGLGRFLQDLARRVEGRVVTPDLDDLGSAVVGSYLGSRTRFGDEPDLGWSDWYGGRGFWSGS